LTDEQRRRNLDWIDLSFGRGQIHPKTFPEPKLLHAFDWSAWKTRQAEEDLRLPLMLGTAASPVEIRDRVVWMLGRKPDRIASSAEEPFLTRAQEIERYGEDRDPDRYPSSDVARIPVVFGEGVRGNLYYSVKTQGRPLPVFLWLHPYNWALGYCSGCEAVIPWGKIVSRTPYHYLASQGFAVLAFDQIGFGTRLLEGRDFYHQYPQWSKLGRMVHDVRAAVSFIVDGKGKSQRPLPNMDKQRICVLGYSLGGMLALYSAALDPRIAGVACFSGFTPMRTDTDAKATGGVRRFWEMHGLLPKLGLYQGREQEIPYDDDDLLRLIASRPCLIVAQKRDRHADFADVAACMKRASEAYGEDGPLTFLTPDDISRFQNDQHDTFLDWINRQPGRRTVQQEGGTP
jgi:dienelactone hydrolase